MVEPGIAWLGVGAVALGAAGLWWPGRGLVPWARSTARLRERVRIEDALKHFHVCEYEGRRVSVASLAGALQVKGARAAGLLSRMAERGLVWIGERGPVLTEAGRVYAAQVIRSHRLWECYLADRTGVAATEWHTRAEAREHSLSAAEADALAARLGHPLYDPHGDPIPSADGALPPAVGVSLAALEPGDVAVVVHVEDEPVESFRVLNGAGLVPGVRLEVLTSRPESVRIRVSGRERTLPRMVAAGVAVRRDAAGGAVEEAVETLAGVEVGESARVVRISAVCQGAQRRRLLDLGVVAGTRVTARMVSAGGDPVAYEIRGALIALRREQAEWIEVARDAAGGE